MNTTRRGSEGGICVRTFTAAANAGRLAAESGPPVPRVHASTPFVPPGGRSKTRAASLRTYCTSS